MDRFKGFSTRADLNKGISWLKNFSLHGDHSFDRVRNWSSVGYWKRLVAMGFLECIKSDEGEKHDIYRINEKGRAFIEQP